MRADGAGRLRLALTGPPAPALWAVAAADVETIAVGEPTLEEIFLALYGEERGQPGRRVPAAGCGGDRVGVRQCWTGWSRQDRRHGRGVEYSIGWAIGEPERTAIIPISGYSPAINADGGVRDGAQVAELTGPLSLAGWPDGMRMIVRRERPHPGAQLTLFEERGGLRYTAFVDGTKVGALQTVVMWWPHSAGNGCHQVH